MTEILKRRYKVRSAANDYKQITVPPECALQVGQRVTVIYNGWVLVVPAGTPVDEKKLMEAILGN